MKYERQMIRFVLPYMDIKCITSVKWVRRKRLYELMQFPWVYSKGCTLENLTIKRLNKWNITICWRRLDPNVCVHQKRVPLMRFCKNEGFRYVACPAAHSSFWFSRQSERYSSAGSRRFRSSPDLYTAYLVITLLYLISFRKLQLKR